MAGWTNLVQAETLAIALSRPDLAIVDCRFSLAAPGAGEAAFQQGHIPHAVYAHLDRDLSDMRKHGEGRHPWPDASDFTAKLAAWGITPDHQVVAYDDGDGAHAARFWFLMRALGHEKVAVLDGGWARWTAIGQPVDTHYRAPAPRKYSGEFDSSRLLDPAQVQERLDAGDLLLDARAAARFRGETEPLDRIAGHVPGARNRPYADNLADGRFKPPAQLADEFRALLDGRSPDHAVVMCGSGVTACHHLLAMERAGLRGARLFTGSWSGWISDPARPIATGDA
ncbi:sulfurtransferase [Lysobacter niastensis]|uniref:Sulfurtransferase n=1 Tax=Lysobacter niastensis TaxID=380629 RepID=A0ABS0B5Q9_9GAMM|nr:sulfurtransferase [Lysobacter niastensis]MBF6024249.1 sulfurtransferase [Lysobacter niastensis]